LLGQQLLQPLYAGTRKHRLSAGTTPKGCIVSVFATPLKQPADPRGRNAELLCNLSSRQNSLIASRDHTIP
jgi:hypothetical protein